MMVRVAWMLTLAAGLAGGGALAPSESATNGTSDNRATAPPANTLPVRITGDDSDAAIASLRSRDLTQEQMGQLIGVVTDVSPEWGALLKERATTDPEGVKRALLSNGGRFLALAVLRDQNPDLYRLKVDELRKQAETKELVRRYRAANQKGDQAAAQAVYARLESAVRELVDLDLRTRAQELAALDRHVTELKNELHRDTSQRQQRIQQMLEELTKMPGAER